MMKKILLFALIGFGICNLAWAAPSKHVVESSDKIIAVVNNDVITQSELDNRIKIIKQQLAQSNQPVPKDEELRSKILDNLISVELQMQLAKRNNINVSEKDIDNAIQMIAKGNHITEAQLKQSMIKSGMDIAAFRSQLKEQIILERMQQMLFAREIVVSDADVDAIMRNPPKQPSVVGGYHVIDVLIPVPDHATAEQTKAAEDTAQTLQGKLPTVSDVAKFVSNTKVNGQTATSNDLGWRRLTDMPEIFAVEVVKLSVGQVSRPIQAPNGFHVLKLVATQGGTPKIQFTKEQAQQMVFRRKMNEKVEKWVKELRAAAYVKINE